MLLFDSLFLKKSDAICEFNLCTTLLTNNIKTINK